MRTEHVIVEKYNPEWKKYFERIAQEILPATGDLLFSIEHVGSTAVEGLSAKPIIDIDLVVKDNSSMTDVIQRLESIGYIHEGNLGIKGREAFRYEEKSYLQPHHIYACPYNSKELQRHITFRNYLRSHPEDAAEYSRIKETAAFLYPNSIEKYIEYKSSYIRRIYRLCGLETD